MKKVETKRKDVRVPTPMIEKIEEYQRSMGISTWTGALLELVRKGYEEYKKEQK